MNTSKNQLLDLMKFNAKEPVSWKATGLKQEISSAKWQKHINDEIEVAIKKTGISLMSARGKLPPDRTSEFFVAKRGDSRVYAESRPQSGKRDFSHPASSSIIFDKIRAAGKCVLAEGNKSYEVTTERTTQLKRNMSGIYIPVANDGLRVYHLNKTPYEAISKFGFRLVSEQSDGKYGKLLVFEGNSQNGRDTVRFHIAPQFGYRVVYSERLLKNNVLSDAYRITSLINVNEYWLPAEIQHNYYVQPIDNTTPDKTIVYQMANHTVNDVPDAILKLELKPGDYEWNEKDNSIYKLGANGERIFQDDTKANSPRAMLPGWLYMASVTSLLVLTILAYVRWKSKQWSEAV